MGQVHIDWNHPLALELQQFYLLTSLDVRNLVTGLPVYSVGSTVAASINEKGQCITVNNNSTSDKISLGPIGGVGPQYDAITAGRSFFWQGKLRDRTTGPYGLFAEGGSNDGIGLIYRTSPNTLNYYVISSVGVDVDNVASTATFVDGDDIKVFFTLSSTPHLEVMLDGVLDYTSGTLGQVQAHVGAPELSGASTFPGTAKAWDGDIELFAVWGRELSRPERISFNNNPYQFLIPAG